MIKNVVFDIGNVLIGFRPDEAMKMVGISEEKIEPLMKASVYTKWWTELDRGFLPEEEVHNYMIEEHPELADEIRLFFRECPPYLVNCYDYAEEWLKSLKERGLKVYLLSNYPVSYFELHSRSCFDFMTYVDGKIVSAYVEKIKPDPEIYRILLQTYGLKAEECIFVDDRRENVAAATKLGFETVWFREFSDASKKLEAILEKYTKIC